VKLNAKISIDPAELEEIFKEVDKTEGTARKNELKKLYFSHFSKHKKGERSVFISFDKVFLELQKRANVNLDDTDYKLLMEIRSEEGALYRSDEIPAHAEVINDFGDVLEKVRTNPLF